MRIFTQHPASVGETYSQHFRHASGFGLAMIAGGCACMVHAVFPWLCERTGSSQIRKLYRSMVTGRADLAKLNEIEGQYDWVI